MPVAVDVEFGDPRGQTKEAAKLLRKPGETVTLVGLVPGAHPAVAALRWTNPPGAAAGAGGRRAGAAAALRPAEMEILDLSQLPSEPALPGSGASRQLDVRSARERLRSLLPAPGQPGHTCCIYIRDSVEATAYATQDKGDPTIVEVVQASLDLMEEAARKLPGVAVYAHVLSPTINRSLKLSTAEMKKKKALEVAWQIFPQSRPLIKAVAHHGPQAQALLVLAHVVGARVHPLEAPPAPVPAAAAAAAHAHAPPAPAAAAAAAAAAAVPAFPAALLLQPAPEAGAGAGQLLPFLGPFPDVMVAAWQQIMALVQQQPALQQQQQAPPQQQQQLQQQAVPRIKSEPMNRGSGQPLAMPTPSPAGGRKRRAAPPAGEAAAAAAAAALHGVKSEVGEERVEAQEPAAAAAGAGKAGFIIPKRRRAAAVAAQLDFNEGPQAAAAGAAAAAAAVAGLAGFIPPDPEAAAAAVKTEPRV